MHDATEQNQGEIFTNWSQGHPTVALWQHSFPYTKGRISIKGLILTIMPQTGFQAIVSACPKTAIPKWCFRSNHQSGLAAAISQLGFTSSSFRWVFLVKQIMLDVISQDNSRNYVFHFEIKAKVALQE